MEMIALKLLRVGRPRMTMYAKGSSTTMKVTMTVLDFSSSPKVTGRMLVLRGEMESPINPVSADSISVRSSLVKPSFRKVAKHRTLAELLVSTMILLTQALAIMAEITNTS